MVAKPAVPYRSANAGEFSPDAKGRVDIKQYYSAGLAYKNVEPVPQSGFRQMGGTRRKAVGRKPLSTRSITSPSTSAGPHTGTQTVWTGTVSGTVAAVLVTSLGISAGTATFEAQANISGVWTKIAGPFAVAASTAVTRLAAFAPGGQQSATSLRIRATFSTSATVTISSVSAFYEDGTPVIPRYAALTTDAGDAVVAAIVPGIVDFFTEDGHAGAARLADVTSGMMPDLDFYAEGNTIGIFHGELETRRLLLATPAQLCDWRSDLWPYEKLPTADLGASYVKTDDIWEVFIRYTSVAAAVHISYTINGEQSEALPVPSTTPGVDWDPDSNTPNWSGYLTALKPLLEALPGLSPTITVAHATLTNYTEKITITLGGALSGEEFDLSAVIANTSDASALATHKQIGKTDFESLFSSTRGWPGTAALVQDRFTLGRSPAVPGSITMSRIAEYFDFNIKGATDQAARLDKLRSQTNEMVVHIREATYLLVFTDRGVYFVPNRTIERNTPLNFVLASEVGAQPNCKPFDLEGETHYVAINPQGIENRADGGKQLLRVAEAVTTSQTSFMAEPVSLLATHLADRLIRSARQKPETDQDAAKGWLMRSDGRLVAAQMIRNQEINGFCEWIAAGGGAIREITVDGKNRLWLAIERAGGALTHEMYDTAIFLQDAVTAVDDLAGLVTGLPYENGATVWAVADGYVLGPFTVSGGSIDLEDPYNNIIVGRWQAPRFESMPNVLVTPGDEVVIRPGRIHTAHINIMDTTSIAVGANGLTPTNIPLAETTDPVGQPTPAKSKHLTVAGLMGMKEYTTLVITQTKPGPLRIRDYATGVKL